MELHAFPDYYIFKDDTHALWCSRIDGSFKYTSVTESEDRNFASTCMGLVYGIVGKFPVHPEFEKKLVVIKKRKSIGYIYGNHEVFKILRVALLPLTQGEIPDLELELCPAHPQSLFSNISITSPSNPQKKMTDSNTFHITWNNIKSATTNRKPKDKDRLDKKVCEALIKGPDPQTNCLPGILLMGACDLISTGKQALENYYDITNTVEREILRMFNETSSFYYSFTGDLTNSIQRQQELNIVDKGSDAVPLWKTVDDRFFWNKFMIQDLIQEENKDMDRWIVPIIQGFVQIETCIVETSDNNSPDNLGMVPKMYTMILISRRSRFRAGTRYKRRGVDENGKVANYVETEQIIVHAQHALSFVQVRGSVPVYWSQPGSKYRPPPRLDQDEEVTKLAFDKHFTEELRIYGNQTIVSLVEQSGKEKIIAHSYLNHIIHFNSPLLVYVTFDFHDYCRGMKFENVSILINSLQGIIKEMRFCWIDQHGVIMTQNGVFRINCIDCLDRTNIVQTAIAKSVMDIQFVKLGLLPPEGQLPVNCRRLFQILWANNGDIISRQYAGTAALKGDYTRTGERKLAGVMKDGYNSANRYYLNRFKDEYRQLTIDLMQGTASSEQLLSPDKDDIPEFDADNSERVRQLIEDTKKFLISEKDPVIGGWALIDADPVTGDHNQIEMDTILILTQECYYVAEYDDQLDRIVSYVKVLLEDLEKIELGPEPSLFKSRRTIMRLHYQVADQSGYFHTFRSACIRFFNNIVVPIKNEEQASEALKAICDTFIFALSNKSLNVPFFQGKLEKRKSKVLTSGHAGNNVSRGFLPTLDIPTIPRNISDNQLGSFKSVSSRAFSSVTSSIARLNPMKNVRNFSRKFSPNTNHAPCNTTYNPRPMFEMDSSSEDEFLDSPLALQKVPQVFQANMGSDYFEFSDYEDNQNEPEPKEDKPCLQDSMLESCGILATSSQNAEVEPILHNSVDVDDFVIESMKKASNRVQYSIEQNESFLPKKRPVSLYPEEHPFSSNQIMPQIQISTENLTPTPSNDNTHFKTRPTKLSKSSEDLDGRSQVTFSSNDVSHLLVHKETDADGVSNKMKTSHSESAIQDFSTPFGFPNPLSSPIVMKKDLVLSPLSRIAKGVQNLGLNFRHSSGNSSPDDLEISEERRLNCQTKIIEI